jgi:hypothetical protein
MTPIRHEVVPLWRAHPMPSRRSAGFLPERAGPRPRRESPRQRCRPRCRPVPPRRRDRRWPHLPPRSCRPSIFEVDPTARRCGHRRPRRAERRSDGHRRTLRSQALASRDPCLRRAVPEALPSRRRAGRPPRRVRPLRARMRARHVHGTSLRETAAARSDSNADRRTGRTGDSFGGPSPPRRIQGQLPRSPTGPGIVDVAAVERDVFSRHKDLAVSELKARRARRSRSRVASIDRRLLA